MSQLLNELALEPGTWDGTAWGVLRRFAGRALVQLFLVGGVALGVFLLLGLLPASWVDAGAVIVLTGLPLVAATLSVFLPGLGARVLWPTPRDGGWAEVFEVATRLAPYADASTPCTLYGPSRVVPGVPPRRWALAVPLRGGGSLRASVEREAVMCTVVVRVEGEGRVTRSPFISALRFPVVALTSASGTINATVAGPHPLWRTPAGSTGVSVADVVGQLVVGLGLPHDGQRAEQVAIAQAPAVVHRGRAPMGAGRAVPQAGSAAWTSRRSVPVATVSADTTRMYADPGSSLIGSLGWYAAGVIGLAGFILLLEPGPTTPLTLGFLTWAYVALMRAWHDSTSALGHVRAEPYPCPPVLRARGELTFDGDVLTMGLGLVEIDLSRRFQVELSREEGDGQHLLNVSLRQRTADGVHASRLDFAVRAEPHADLEALPALADQAPVLDSTAFVAWVWPLICERAALHGERVDWTAGVEAAPVEVGVSALAEVEWGR